MTVAGIVLAAGASRRMAQPKLLLPFRGGTILTATVAAFLDAGLDLVVVVTGHDADAIEDSLAELPVEVARNPDPDRGTMSSLRTGFESTDAEAVVYAPGDVPTLHPSVVAGAGRMWRRDAPWAAVTQYRNRIAHPFLVSRRAIDEFSGEQGDRVLWRALVESGDERVGRIDVASDAPLDVNTPEDFRALGAMSPKPPGERAQGDE